MDYLAKLPYTQELITGYEQKTSIVILIVMGLFVIFVGMLAYEVFKKKKVTTVYAGIAVIGIILSIISHVAVTKSQDTLSDIQVESYVIFFKNYSNYGNRNPESSREEIVKYLTENGYSYFTYDKAIEVLTAVDNNDFNDATLKRINDLQEAINNTPPVTTEG